MSLYIVDPLLALPGRESEMRANWNALVFAAKKQPGFHSASLLRATASAVDVRLSPFTHVSLFVFESEQEHAHAAIRAALQLGQASLTTTCLSHPGLFVQDTHVSGNILLSEP